MDVDATIAATRAAGAARTQQQALGPGQRVGRYVVSRRLGLGSMGVVYVAHDPQLERDVAVKLVAFEGSRAGASERVLREARAIARLNHPNVVVVNDVGRHGDAVFIAMELVEGQTLTRWLSARRRPWRGILETLLQAGEGLAAAHAAGLVHRDFKPDNVLVGDDGRVRVLDFGLARPLQSRPGTLPESVEQQEVISQGTSVATRGSGTPAYMAPEQFEQQALGPQADQFSFCVALWEALFGQRPFLGDTFVTIGAAVTLGHRRAPPSGADVPRSVTRALDRGLSRDPQQRWPSMRALLDALGGEERTRSSVLWMLTPNRDGWGGHRGRGGDR